MRQPYLPLGLETLSMDISLESPSLPRRPF